jgi:hypothetical protein
VTVRVELRPLAPSPGLTAKQSAYFPRRWQGRTRAAPPRGRRGRKFRRFQKSGEPFGVGVVDIMIVSLSAPLS